MNEGKDDVVIRIISTPKMVIAPEWVRDTMINIELKARETTEIKVCGAVKTPIKGYIVSLKEVIDAAKTSNWLKDNLLRDTNQLIFFEHTCCKRVVSE